MLRIFFDADILFALSYTKNPMSGARMVILQGYVGKYSFITSAAVIEETRRNLSPYNNSDYVKRLGELLQDFNFLVMKALDEKLVDAYKDTIDQKDTHVLVGAIQSNADYLLTFNKKHFLTPRFKKLNLKLQIVTPKEFIQKMILTRASPSAQ